VIKTLFIRNYGSNRKMDIDLDKRITCLTGESYTGKSWAVRAVKWIALNRPSGISFIRWGSKSAVVIIETDKSDVSRRRSKTDNVYIVDGTPLKAFGNDVPDKVRKILNLSDLNFQTQQEMPHGAGPLFWFALSPGEVAKRLNKIVNLDLIDRTLGNLSKLVHRAKVELDVCRERRSEARAKAESLAFVDSMVVEWEEVKVVDGKAAALENETHALDCLIQDITQQKQTVNGAKVHLRQADMDLSELEALREAIIEIRQEEKDLSQVLDEIEQLESSLIEDRKELSWAEQNYAKAMKGRCPLCGRK